MKFMSTMAKDILLLYLFILILTVNLSSASFIFNVNTSIQFVPPTMTDDYFGYSTLLTTNGLFIGAPRATLSGKKTGVIFFCSLKDIKVNKVTCKKIERLQILDYNKLLFFNSSILVDDSWFGSSMAWINDSLLITAPRLTSKYDYGDETLSRLQGASYMMAGNRFRPFEPLLDNKNKRYQKISLDGSKPIYGENNTDIYYYSLGQFGFSMAITKMNTLLFGAPGLMKSAGGILSYATKMSKNYLNTYLQPITNPYYTVYLEPGDNFGYSVDSGTFVKKGPVLYVGGAPRSELARGKCPMTFTRDMLARLRDTITYRRGARSFTFDYDFNASVLIIAPEELEYSNTRVDEQESTNPLDVRFNLMGPQVGSYFGASVCCTDLDGDGVDDLLVGAPTFAEKKNDKLSYDQGAVFIYLTRKAKTGFHLEPSGYVSGSGADGVRFGTTITNLGDIDGDNCADVAISAPWEDNGVGAVYIYRGYKFGLKTDKVQRIQAPGARGYGFSVSAGVDVDKNGCNDLAVGAYNSSTVYLYRCIPTINVTPSIRVANGNRVNLPINATIFTANFCLSSPPMTPEAKLTLNVTMQAANTEINRTRVIEDLWYEINLTSGEDICTIKTFHVNPEADLFEPVRLNFTLIPTELMNENTTTFIMGAVRLSDNTENITVPVQLMRDCGDDLVCIPWLNISMEAFDDVYIPGITKRLGFKISVWNVADPAYGLKLILTLPLHPKRTPRGCLLKELIMYCDMPRLFGRNESIAWEIEMDYNLKITSPVKLTVQAKVNDTFSRSNITAREVNEMSIEVTPKASFTLKGKAMPSETLVITRSKLDKGKTVFFQHHLAITNKGPSDWHNLSANLWIPERAHLTTSIDGCEMINTESVYKCQWPIPANTSFPVYVPMWIDLSIEGEYLQKHMGYNATTVIVIQLNDSKFYNRYVVTTALVLEPVNIFWLIVLPCILLGLIVLAIIIGILYMCGFFRRAKRREVKIPETVTEYTYTNVNTSPTAPPLDLDEDTADIGEPSQQFDDIPFIDRSSGSDLSELNLNDRRNHEVNVNVGINRTPYHAKNYESNVCIS